MADIADVMDVLVNMAFAACYPAGVGTESILGKPITVGEGWPLAEDLDVAMKAGNAIVSVYQMPGSTQNVPQIFDWTGYVLVAPVHGISVAVAEDGASAAFSGTMAPNAYLSLVINNVAFNYTVQEATDEVAVTSALLALIAADFPDATADGATLTVPSAFDFAVRIGAPGTLGRLIHRQITQFQIVTWASSPAARTLIGRAIDIVMKRPVRLTMPDMTTAVVTPRDTRMSDREENKAIYRRDLILAIQFDTVATQTAYEVTSITISGDAPTYPPLTIA